MVGATFVGAAVTELVHSATIAMAARCRWSVSGTPSPLVPQ